MIKFAVKGDLHNMWDDYIAELTGKDYSFSICVGDNGIFPDLSFIPIVDPKTEEKFDGDKLLEFTADIKMPIPVYSVPGNHEDQEFLDDRYDENGIFRAKENLTLIHGGILNIAPGIYVAGIGKLFIPGTYERFSKEELSNYGLRNKRKLNKGMIKKRNHNTKEEITFFHNNLKAFNKVRKDTDKLIWVSHDAPRHTDPRRDVTVGSEMVSELLAVANPDYAFFGHYHHSVVFNETEQIIAKYALKEFII